MKYAQNLIYAGAVILAIVIVSMIGYNIFHAHNEAYVDKHIREIKYEEAQIYADENKSIEEKLNGQEDISNKEIPGQEDEQSPDRRQETGSQER